MKKERKITILPWARFEGEKLGLCYGSEALSIVNAIRV